MSMAVSANAELEAEIVALRAENERLRDGLDLRNQTALDRKEIIIKLEAEVERLQFQNDNLIKMNEQERSYNAEWATRWNSAMGERDAALAEIEKLRADPAAS
jgi:hypothetical protein